MTRSEVREVVVGALANQVGPQRPLLDDTPLFEPGLDLDSIQFLETVVAIEQGTGVVLRGEDLTADAIATVGSMIEHVLGLCGE